MIDIVTVVFRDELPVLKLQAESINLYCQNLGNILIIINDDSMSVEDVNPSWYGSMAGQVKIMHRRDLADSWDNNGWLTQQLCKLLASASIKLSTWAMILDAKTILIEPVKHSRLFDKLGRLTWGYSSIAPVFEPSRKLVSELFGINLQHIAGPSGVPFFFNNSIVRSMIKEVETRTHTPFSKWFQEVGMITEFILYSGYIQYVEGSLDKQYTDPTPTSYAVCNICHSEVQSFDRKFLEMLIPNVLTVGIHRNAWSQLNLEQKKKYQDLLISKGITQAKDLQ